MLSTVNLETVRVTNVQGLPYGIAYGCQRMFVTFSKPSKLEIREPNGALIKKVLLYLGDPRSVSVTRQGHILISNKDTIVRIDKENKVNYYRPSHVKTPRGLLSLANGSVLICDKDIDAVMHQTGPDLSTLIRDGRISRPVSLLWDEDKALLYVSCDTAKDQFDNTIKVFRFE